MACNFLITQSGNFLTAQDGTNFVTQDTNPSDCFAGGALGSGNVRIKIGTPYSGPGCIDIGYGLLDSKTRINQEVIDGPRP